MPSRNKLIKQIKKYAEELSLNEDNEPMLKYNCELLITYSRELSYLLNKKEKGVSHEE
jgi:cysteine sulfinate desulfinase/cysteine desulfurase-like protein